MKTSSSQKSAQWSEKIIAYFLHNYRLTALALVFVVGLGIASTLLMRTTGFPSQIGRAHV